MTVRDRLPDPVTELRPRQQADGPILYLARHGETVWNREGRLQGRLDSPLTALGMDQAQRIGETLSALIDEPGYFSLVCSPLGRAYHTMELIAREIDLDPRACRIDRRLKEMSWGRWDGLTHGEIQRYFPDALAERDENPWRYAPPGGESYAMVAARLGPFLDEAVGHGKLIIVAHGVVGKVLRGLYGRLSPEETMHQPEPQDAVFRLQEGTIAAFASEAA
ncbi:MAG: histidine phosphatase family protein [Pseudomonadota bacterium]